MPELAAAEIAARVRAVLAYANIEVTHAHERKDISIGKATMARIVSSTNPRGASQQEREELALACGVPPAFMEQGFALFEADLAVEIQTLQTEVEDFRTRLDKLARQVRSQDATAAAKTAGGDLQNPPGSLGHALQDGPPTTPPSDQEEDSAGPDQQRGSGR